jgi:hypothetical protein
VALDRRLGQLLRASIALDGPTPTAVLRAASPGDLEGVAVAAERHGVAGYVHRAVAGSPAVPGAEVALLNEYRLAAVRNHLRTIGDLRYLHRVLGSAGIPWLVVKGPALASLHEGPELRSYRDLDVLVPARQFGGAVGALRDAGCVVPRHDWTLLREALGGEIDVFMPSGTHLDLHWHLISDLADRQHYTIDMDGLFEHQRNLALGSDRFATLSLTDTALHVALHAMLSGAQRLIAMKDLQLLLLSSDLTAAQLLARAQDWQALIAVRVALVRMGQAIGVSSAVSVPDPVGIERPWAFAARAVEAVSPLERIDRSFSLGRTFSKAARGGGAAGLSYLTRRTRDKLLDLGTRSGRRRVRHGAGAAEPDGQLERTGDQERERFFDTVAQH